MTQVLQAAMLNLLGLSLIAITLSGTYLSYVKESMRLPLLATGAVIILLAITWFLDAARTPRHDASEHDDDHGHSHGSALSAWFLLVPGIVLFFAAPPALGSYDAARSTGNDVPVVVAEDYEQPLPAGDPVTIRLTDFVIRAISDGGNTVRDRSVSLTGFVTPDPDGGWWLARQSMSCCAADARPVRIRMVDAPPSWANPDADTWVTVTGSWIPQTLETDAATIPIPELRVTGIEQIDQPSNPYE